MKNPHKTLTTESYLVETKDLFKLAQGLIGKARHEIRAGKEVKLNHFMVQILMYTIKIGQRWIQL